MNLSYTPKQAYDPNDPYWFLRQRQGDAVTGAPGAAPMAETETAIPSTAAAKGPNWGEVARGVSSLASDTGNRENAAGNIIGGGVTGAMAGSSLGPWGAVGGAVLGIGSGIAKTVSGNEKAVQESHDKAQEENTARLESMRSAAKGDILNKETSAASKMANLAKMRNDAAERYRFRSFRNLVLRGGV